MLFTSYSFIGFLAVLFLLYYTIPTKYRKALLLVANFCFYYIADPRYILFIAATILSIWYAGMRIGDNWLAQERGLAEMDFPDRDAKKAYREAQKKIRKRWMLAALLFNLGIMAVIKYTNFVIYNVNGILSASGSTQQLSFVNIIMPMGISFYTFQALSYLFDVNRGTCQAERSLPRFALFVSFFPQLVQGPISRYPDLSQTLYNEEPFDMKNLSFGLQRMLWGYFKKLLVADRMLALVRTVTGDPSTYHGSYALVAMLFYSIGLYADFTGGIDITIGVAECLGIKLQENFNLPYFSDSLAEFWRRWHMTMSSWFREYMFFPLSTSRQMGRFAKFVKTHFGNALGKRLPLYLSSFIVWFATGIWHGASWNFIFWGLANWAILMVSQELEGFYSGMRERYAFFRTSAFKVIAVIRTFLLLSLLNFIDCYLNIIHMFKTFFSIFTTSNYHLLFDGSMLKLGMSGPDFIAALAGSLVMLAVGLMQVKGGSIRERVAQKSPAFRLVFWYGMFLIVLVFGAYGVGYDASQFVYNQF